MNTPIPPLAKQVKEMMCSERIVRKTSSIHQITEALAVPTVIPKNTQVSSSGELRMEQKYNCIDCHGVTRRFAKYHFEEIEAEYKKSIHLKWRMTDSLAGSATIHILIR